MSVSNSVNEALRAGFVGPQFHAVAAIDGITLGFLEGAASDDGDG